MPKRSALKEFPCLVAALVPWGFVDTKSIPDI